MEVSGALVASLAGVVEEVGAVIVVAVGLALGIDTARAVFAIFTGGAGGREGNVPVIVAGGPLRLLPESAGRLAVGFTFCSGRLDRELEWLCSCDFARRSRSSCETSS